MMIPTKSDVADAAASFAQTVADEFRSLRSQNGEAQAAGYFEAREASCRKFARDMLVMGAPGVPELNVIRRTHPFDSGFEDFLGEWRNRGWRIITTLYERGIGWLAYLERDVEHGSAQDDYVEWFIHYEDQDMPDEVFDGEHGEGFARERFRQMSSAWSCSLFKRVAITPKREEHT